MSETIVFFGSGPVAAESLRLLARDFAIEAVVTKPRPQHHRGEVPVLTLAEELKLPIKTASTKSELDALFAQKPFQSKLGVLVDFGIIVSEEVIDYFPLGIVNSHFSLLPEWRGADPITFAILSGQQKTGVSLMLLVEAMDEGPLLAQKTYDIPEGTTTPLLTNALVQLSYEMLVDIIPRYAANQVRPAAQEDVTIASSKQPTYSRKLTKADSELDWSKPASVLEREIRAFCEWPKSRTVLGGKEVIITEAAALPYTTPNTKPGDTTFAKEIDAIVIATKEGSLAVKKLKPSGKREMSASDFMAGYKHLLQQN